LQGIKRFENFKAAEIIGVYFGQIRNPDEESFSCYSLTSHTYGVVLDCMGGLDSPNPIYFGLQFANDPFLTINSMKTRNVINEFSHNFFIDDNLIARAITDIKIGEELYLYYGWQDSNEDAELNQCSCDGCAIRQFEFCYEV
jgi:hypothetical protein